MEAAVQMTGVKKQYGKVCVLDEVSMQIEKGEIYGLIGPSGAGKTTLVKLVMGMEKMDAGEIILLGKQIPNLSVLQSIGYMAQSDVLYQELTAYENLQFFAQLFRLSKREREERIRYAADVVHLTDFLKRKVSTFSGGMKRRLSLAVALIQNPEILILDEPTVGIDLELHKSVWDELIRLKNQEHKTIIVTTHVMDKAGRCDRLAMVREGKVITGGSPDGLKKLYGVETL